VRRSRREPAVLVVSRVRPARWASSGRSERTTCRKTDNEQLRPTPAQQRELERVGWRGRTLDHAALEQRITAWQRCRVALARSRQDAELKDIRAAFPDSAALHRHVVHDVLARVDKT